MYANVVFFISFARLTFDWDVYLNLKVANFEFYQDLEKKCCSYLVHMEMLTCSTRDAGIVQGGYILISSVS